MSEPQIEPVEPEDSGEDVWAGPSQEEWEQTQQDLAAARELVQAVQYARSADEGPLSGYDPEFRQELDQYIEQKLSPYSGFQQQAVLAEAEERARDILNDDSVANGEFNIDLARQRADMLLPQFNERYGATPKAAEAALRAAAQAQREYEAEIRQQAIDQYKNELGGISRAPREAAAAGNAATALHVSTEGKDELDIVKNYFPTAR